MSFSIAAVLILLISGFAVTAVSQSEKGSQAMTSSGSAQRMKNLSDQAMIDTEVTAHSTAVTLVMDSDLDPVRMLSAYSSAIQEAMASSYPKNIGGYGVMVDCSDLRLMVLSLPISTFYELAPTSENEGSASIPAYFNIVGKVRVNVSHSSDHLVAERDIDREVFIPIPLLKDRLDQFQQSTEGSSSMLWRIIHYELSALLQYRLLGPEAVGPMPSQDILDEVDVKNAYVLATILVQIFCFGTYDRSLIQCFYHPDVGGLDLKRLQLDLTKASGDTDPADLFLGLYRADRIYPSVVLAQSLYSSADLLALRWLDYLHITEALDTLQCVYETGLTSAERVLGLLMDRDITGEKAEQWLGRLMSEAGVDELEYRYFCESQPDHFVTLPEGSLLLRNDTGGWVEVSVGGSFPVDLGPVDLFDAVDWSDFNEEYRRSAGLLLHRLTLALKEMALDISSGAKGSIELTLDPNDGIGFLEEADLRIRSMMQEGDWYEKGDHQQTTLFLADPMGEAFMNYLQANPDPIFRTNDTVDLACDKLASSIYDNMIAGRSDIIGLYQTENIEIIENALRPGGSVGSAVQVSMLYQEDIASFLEQYGSWLNGTHGLGQSWIDSTLISLAGGLIDNVPGVEGWVRSRIGEVLMDLDQVAQIRSEKFTLNLKNDGPFELMMGRGLIIKEQLEVRSSIDSRDDLDRCFLISVKDPTELVEISPSLHITDLRNCSYAPFQNIWSIAMLGAIDVTLSASCPGAEKNISLTRHCEIFSTRILVGVTAWPLSQVDYTCSNTLDQDVLTLLKQIYDTMAKAMCSLGEGAMLLLDYLMNALTELSRYCVKGMDDMAKALCDMVGSLQDWMLSRFIGALGHLVEEFFPEGTEHTTLFEIWGVECMVQVRGKGTALHDATELVSFTMHQDFGDSGVSLTSRLLHLPDGEYYLLTNGTLTSPGMKLSLVVDPMMSMFDHFIEVTGLIDGRTIEITLPDYSYDQKVSFTLSQVPGLGQLLSNIPLPVPGVKAQIDAGFYFKFATSNLDHPIINEYEQNPSGRDSENEWVEIYNPTDRVVSLSGWTLRTAHGLTRLDELGETLILPRGHVVYRYRGQALDNGDSSRFPFAESVALYDTSGKKVDATPFTFDEQNDQRTWQRSYDAGDGWDFRLGTPGLPNSPLQSGQIDQDDIYGIVMSTLTESLEQLEALGYSLESLSKVLETAINNLITRLLDLLFEKVAEVGLFIELAMCDETGALSTGFKTTLLVDGNFLPQAFEWFGDVVRELLDDPLRPLSPETAKAGERVLTENIWVEFTISTQAGLPEELLSQSESIQIKQCSQIKANLAQIGDCLDIDLGRSKLCAGIFISGVPQDVVTTLPFAKSSINTEYWLVRLTVMDS